MRLNPICGACFFIGKNKWNLQFAIFTLQKGATPLYIAAEKGKTDTVHYLVQNGADVNRPKKVRN